MSFRFRKSVKLFPGVRLNVSKSGISVSVGGPGATLNFSQRGTTLSVGIPGSGLSFRQDLTSRSERSKGASPQSAPPPSRRAVSPLDPSPGLQSKTLVGEIASGEVATLTSGDLQGLKRLVNEASAQRASLKPDLAEAARSRQQAWRKLRRREQLPLSVIMKSYIPRCREAFEESEVELQKVVVAIAQSELHVEFTLGAIAKRAYAELVDAHEQLARAHRFWDVTSSISVDRFRARSAASSSITRTVVPLARVSDGIIKSHEAGLRVGNANGADLDFYPGLLLMRENTSTDFALVDLRDIRIECGATRFIEEEPVPTDAEVVDYVWAKSNKDGSPDRRFSNNYQIPVARYGFILFSSDSGLLEAYHCSNYPAAERFCGALVALQAALQSQVETQGAEPVSAPSNAALEDPRALFPPLKPVRRAHEFTALAAALLAIVGLGVVGQRSAPAPAFDGRPIALVTEAVPAKTQIPSTPLDPSGSPPPAETAPSASLAAQHFEELKPPPPASVSTITTKRGANIRLQPATSSPITRTIGPGTTLDVYGRNGAWLEVGQSAHWGWMHSAALNTAR